MQGRRLMMLTGKNAGQVAEQVSSILIVTLSFWVLCYRLDGVPMYLWDESRQANNALEMLESGNLWYTTYDGQPDFWNTKPHLLILLQCVCMKLWGPGLLALRLPSALAGCLVLWIGFRFLQKRSGFTYAAAWIAVMLGSGGFNTYHVVRTGDYDALLTLFIFLTTLSWLKYLEDQTQTKSLRFAAIWFTAALLTKGIAAALWLPCWFVMGFAVKPYMQFKSVELIKASLIPILAVIFYYGLHEWLTPGYLHAVFENELSGRYLQSNEGHGSQWYYYAEVIWSHYFKGFIVLMVIAGVMVKSYGGRLLYSRMLAGILLFLIIISVSATRIYWYVAPAIPLMALLVILPMADHNNRIFQWSWSLLIVVFLVIGYYNNFRHNTISEGVSPAKVLLHSEKSGKLPYNAIWHVGHYYPIEKYYAAVLKKKGIDLPISSVYRYKQNDTLIVGNMAHLDTLNRLFFMRQHQYPTDVSPVWVMVVDSARNR